MISLRDDIALRAMIYAAAYEGTDNISYCDEGAIYHTASAVYHIAQRYIIDRNIVILYNPYRVIIMSDNKLLDLSFEFAVAIVILFL